MTAEPMLQTELWISFVSMLRSYAAAAGLHGGEVHVATTGNTVEITSSATELDMRFDPDSSQVYWTKRAASQGPVTGTLTIQPEGTIHVNGASKDLDHAAIDFIASVTEPGKGSRP
jgi:hypothetical protein